MKKNLLVFFILIFSEIGFSQIINGRFSSSLYSFEIFDTVGVSNSYLRAFQTMQLDITKDKYSFNTLIYANSNILGDIKEASTLKIYNIFFKARKIFNVLEINLGRQYVFGGVANGLIDGSVLKLNLLKNQLIIKGFAGTNVNKDLKPDFSTKFKNNHLVGFHLIGNPLDNLFLSISYMNRHRERTRYEVNRPDTIGIVYNHTIEYNSAAEQFVGADFDYDFPKYIRFNARYDYDLNQNKTSRIQLSSRVKLSDKFSLTAEYINRTPRIYYNSIFNVFQSNNTQEIEGGLEYLYNPSLRIFTKFANISYSDDKANRFTLGVNTSYGSLTYSGSNGYSGELSSVSGQIFYPLLERKIIPTISVTRSSYKLTKNSDRYESFAGAFGAAVNILKSFSFDVQLHWLSNRLYKDDVRLLLKANYFFTQNLNIL